MSSGEIGREQLMQKRESGPSEQKSQQRAGHGDEKVLRQADADQLPRAGSEGAAERQFLTACDGTGDAETANVGAGDQHHQRARGREEPDQLARAPCHFV